MKYFIQQLCLLCFIFNIRMITLHPLCVILFISILCIVNLQLHLNKTSLV